MAENHQIVGPPRGEPLLAGQVGARVRIPLSGTPGPRWSRVFTARLSSALTGQPAIGYLKMAELVQGADIVIEGVEADEAERLGQALSAALDAANRDAQHGPEQAKQHHNMTVEEANAIASHVVVEPGPMAGRRPSSESFPGR